MKIRILQVMMIIAIIIGALCLMVGILAIGTGSDNVIGIAYAILWIGGASTIQFVVIGNANPFYLFGKTSNL